MRQTAAILLIFVTSLFGQSGRGGHGGMGGHSGMGGGPPKGGTVALVSSGEGFVTGTTDSFTLPATTGAGHILYVGDGAAATGSHISSITGGGTWVVPAGCATDDSGAGIGVSCGYVLSSSSGTTSITINWNGSSVQHIWWYYEYSCTATASFDTAAAFDQPTNTNPLLGVSQTLTGLSDLLFQMIKTSFDTPTGISAPYGHFNSDSNQLAWATSENTTSGSAPTWTDANSQRYVAGALAIKCQ